MTCIISPYVKDRSGYAVKVYKGKMHQHHRAVYAEHNNIDIDDMKGLVVMHLCDTRPCINPDHLHLGTYQDNTDDMLNKKRQKSKLTEAEVLEIRASTKSGVDLAIDYGVTKGLITHIRKRRVWRHI